MSFDSIAGAGDRPMEQQQPGDDALSDLLDRLTARLRSDPELRLEVRQELRTHLEESIAQFQHGGRSDTDARAEAIRALGDEQELAEQLWRANRRRLRMRAAAVWATRLVLPILALTLITQLNRGVVTAWALSYQIVGGRTFLSGPPRPAQIANDYRAAIANAAPEDARKLFRMEDTTGEQRLALARELVEAHPSDPALFANFAAMALMRDPIHYSATTPFPRIDQPLLDDTLAILSEGERREPDNALYPILTAGLLFESSFFEDPDPSLTIHRPGRKSSDDWGRAKVFDPPRYARALEALHRAAAKPYLKSYTGELERRRLNAIPLNQVADVWLRATEEVRTLMPTLGTQRSATWGGSIRATDAVREGHRQEADQLLRDLQLLPGLAAAGADKEIELHVANDSLASALMADAFAHEVARDSAGAAAAWARYDEHYRARNRLFPREDASFWEAKRQAGILYSTLPPPFSGRYTTDVAPMRRAEYAAFDQLGIGAVASAAVLLAAVYAVVALIAWLRAPRDSKPPRLFIGWRRVAWIVGVGAMLPVGIYFLYAALTPLGGRRNGLNVTLPRVSAEYAVLAAAVMVLLGVLTRRAVQRRATDLGLTNWPNDRVNLARSLFSMASAMLALACLIGAIATAFDWVDVPFLPPKRAGIGPLVLLLGCFALLAAAGILRLNRGGSPGGLLFYSGIVARSAFPVVLIAAVIVSLLGLPLRGLESREVQRAASATPTAAFLTQIGAPRYQTMRERLIDQREVLLRSSPQ